MKITCIQKNQKHDSQFCTKQDNNTKVDGSTWCRSPLNSFVCANKKVTLQTFYPVHLSVVSLISYLLAHDQMPGDVAMEGPCPRVVGDKPHHSPPTSPLSGLVFIRLHSVRDDRGCVSINGVCDVQRVQLVLRSCPIPYAHSYYPERVTV